MTLRPVVVAGGRGTRLWPLSTSDRPKQFHALAGPSPMVVATIERLDALDAAPPIVVCAVDHASLVAELLAGREVQVVAEPSGRSTAPAVAVAAGMVDPEDVLLVAPADHLIANPAAFHRAVDTATRLAADGHVVVFGVVADRPATGYGWILQDAPVGDGPGRTVGAFTEKPDAPTAERHLADGLLWNSGMVCVRAGVFLEELGRHRPDVMDAVAEATMTGGIDPEAWARVPAVSVDVAVLEQTDRAVVVPLDAGWSDVGSWDSLWRESSRDADGNTLDGDVVVAATTGSLVRASSRRVVVIGLDDVVVVETPDAVLVVARDHADTVTPPTD